VDSLFENVVNPNFGEDQFFDPSTANHFEAADEDFETSDVRFIISSQSRRLTVSSRGSSGVQAQARASSSGVLPKLQVFFFCFSSAHPYTYIPLSSA